MPRERNAFRLGLTLIVFFILFLAVLVFLAPRGGGDLRFSVRYPHDAFATVLKPGGEVSCGGAAVGTIKSVDLREMKNGKAGEGATLYVVVDVAVDSSLGLRKDCTIMPEDLLLGGPGKLVIANRGVGEPLKGGEQIDGETVVSVAALTRLLGAQLDPDDPRSLLAMIRGQLDPADARSMVSKLHTSMDDLNVVTASIRNQLDARERAALMAKLHGILDHINETTSLLRNEMDRSAGATMLAKLHAMLDTLDGGLNTATAMLTENREPIAQAVGHLRGTTRILEERIATRIAQQLDPADAASLVAKVHVSIDRLGTSLRDINVITASSRELIVLNQEQLGRMVGNMKETSDHLKAASKEIRRSPWRLFYQPTVEEAAQANIFDAARSFSEAATRLDDAVVRIEAMTGGDLGTQPAGDDQLIEIRDALQQTFQNFTKAEAALWESLKIK
jgi:ABC-type transporter Mla subunit MlaD